MPPIDAALERNRRFAASGTYRDATIMPKLGLFVITCLDQHVDPAAFFGLELGDAAVVRNAGGRVTDAVIHDVAYTGQLVERAAGGTAVRGRGGCATTSVAPVRWPTTASANATRSASAPTQRACLILPCSTRRRRFAPT